jgi:hypothetical protein
MIEIKLTLSKILKKYKLERTEEKYSTMVKGFILNKPVNTKLAKFTSI